ncbi:MAG: ArnT family glycosyltransferase [Chloroflexota bacterium]
MPGSIWSAAADVQVRNHWLERGRPRTGAAERAIRARGTAWPAFLVGVFFLSLYLLTMGGHLDSPDEELMFQVTRSLAERGSMDISGTGVAERLTLTGADGRTYVPYSPVASVISVPFYKIGQGLAAGLPMRYSEVTTRFAVGLRDPLISALACVVFFALAVELGYGAYVAMLLTIALGVATLVWPFSKYSFSEPVTGFFLLVSVYAAFTAVRSTRLVWSAVSGIALGLAVGSKATAAFAVPALLVYLGVAGAPSLHTRVRRLVPFVVILGLPAAALAYVNLTRFGNPLDTGYHIQGVIDPSHWVGIAGLLVSPSKSVFVYAPMALLGVAGLVPLARRLPWEMGALLWLIASHIVFHGLLSIWPGDAGWGPRYLVPIVPFMVLPAGAVLAWSCGNVRRVAWAAFGVLFVLGVFANLGGVLVDQRVSFVQLLDEAGGNFGVMDEHRWEPRLSPVLIHWAEVAKRFSGFGQALSQPVSLESGTYGKESSEVGDSSVSGLFPRWTSGSAVFVLRNHGQPTQLWLEYLDNRPESLGAASVHIVVDGAVIPEANVTRVKSEVALPDKRFPWLVEARLDDAVAGRDSSTLEIRSNTWQPARDTPPIPDVRELGIEIWDLRLSSNGQDLAMGESLLSPMPVSDARPWSNELENWFYTPPWHLVDVWPWYLYLSGLPRSLLLLELAPLIGVAWSGVLLARLMRAAAS